ncbi:MAG TPA: Holliday junction resolvase RuvX [Nevskiaceae bacterium]|nr:Holliday junction resolvase RuvX [Nevskiaceae bacterium]
MSNQNNSSVIALDMGQKRIGVAIASLVARIARPLTTLQHTETIIDDLKQLLVEHQAAALVVGLPRGLEGQHTAQTASVEAFVATLKKHIAVPLYWQDEAVTSHHAETELEARKKPFSKGDIDALAATYILEDFLQELPKELK